MPDKFLYETLDAVSQMGFLKKEIPNYLSDNLNPVFELRPYQVEAYARFFHCLDNDFPGKESPLHLLFNMATGSGKTLIMAGLILYLYEKGYRNFLFFVNYGKNPSRTIIRRACVTLARHRRKLIPELVREPGDSGRCGG